MQNIHHKNNELLIKLNEINSKNVEIYQKTIELNFKNLELQQKNIELFSELNKNESNKRKRFT
jgi:transposase-like protein